LLRSALASPSAKQKLDFHAVTRKHNASVGGAIKDARPLADGVDIRHSADARDRHSDLARGQIRAAEDWWRRNRPKAPHAIREEIERAASIISIQPAQERER
jgi:hypothetical protein